MGTQPTVETVPRTFRRESRLFLAVAVLLILFLNFLTLLFFRQSVQWGTRETELRAAQLLRRMAFAGGEARDSLDRVALEEDVVFVAQYDARNHRIRGIGRELEAPAILPFERPRPGSTIREWRASPSCLLMALSAPGGTFLVALDPGAGGVLQTYERWATVLVPLAGFAFAVLAWLYLKSLLAPYDRLLATAGSAASPAAFPKAEEDERDFLLRKFQSTIDALSEKEQELERLARREKERADDLEIAARTLARTLPTGLVSVDREGRVVELNEAGREILGIGGDVRGAELFSVLPSASAFAAVIATALKRREAVSRQEVLFGDGDGGRVLGVTATPAHGADGRFLGVLALFSDLTEVRRLESRMALARHMAALGEVSAGAAHEFRNAAAAIDGFADLALRDPPRAPEHLKAIRQEAQEMSRVTRDFLLFARPEEFVPERVSLETVVGDAVSETERAFEAVRIDRSGSFPDVPGSPVLLRRAIANLLRNAVEATPRERRGDADAVALAGEIADRETVIRVGDRGRGVEPAVREKVFLPFYSSKPGGAGFGLAIVARIAELHGGTVEVTARPGGGALFTLRLPLPSREAEPPRSSAARSPGELPPPQRDPPASP